MRLTNHLRECFVKAVMNDVPTPVRPNNKAIQEALYEKFDPKIKAVYDDENLREALRKTYRCNGITGEYLTTAGFDEDKLDISITYAKAVEDRNKVVRQLHAVADGCKNLKQLQEALPDLVKYMVSEDKPTPVNLPAITGTVDALRALGWKS